eukprot:jgi/Hompol1/4286/HPOL_003567-RA
MAAFALETNVALVPELQSDTCCIGITDPNPSDIIIAAYPGAKQKISAFIQKVYEGSGDAKIQVVEVPENCGSADALRAIRGKLKAGPTLTDFIVISCDLITDIPAHHMINSFRLHTPTMTALIFDSTQLEAVADKPPSKDNDQSEFIGIDDRTSRLLIMANRADLDDDFELRVSMISKFPAIHLHSQLRDAHLYIFRKWVLELLAKNKSVSSIKNDLVPLLLECQHRESIVRHEGIDKLLAAHQDPLQRALALSSSGTTTQTAHHVTCNAVVYRTGFTARANTLWSYTELNRHRIKSISSAPSATTTASTAATATATNDLRISTNAEISPRSQIGQDSMVGESTKVDERCSVKKSVLGNHCSVGKGVKITNCVIMDYVQIGDK